MIAAGSDYTGWFRSPAMWPVLEGYIARHFASVTVWSGACATGEEAYSIAMMLTELTVDGTVLASDVSEHSVLHALRGAYDASLVERDVALGRLSRRRVSRWMYRDGDYYRVAPQIRERVFYSVADLGTVVPPVCDLAFVRNAWRHLPIDRQQHLADELREALASPDARLVIAGADLFTATLRDSTPPALAQAFVEAEHPLIWKLR
ncbi:MULTISPECIES: CheR family methyltransferase [Gordonia]|uniref:CheR family methyltransferase n=1 Tax=Gordonia amicalis TaxID=89053 RepID=A0ABU4DEK9_9ACTN|nr:MULTISPECIES: CheR family methyltransferase [Gordonia]MCZ4654234.1 hypothetical protein [Gordonia amicalis]MDJ0452111.1 CheR family methyltransferase [Gordonia amicalis]MDV6308182.1 CheR family methyltransferase [Gordonia amicalis]MDV7076942.1 CheR family methyltransferase [Gordonia amicalis]